MYACRATKARDGVTQREVDDEGLLTMSTTAPLADPLSKGKPVRILGTMPWRRGAKKGVKKTANTFADRYESTDLNLLYSWLSFPGC